MTTKSYPNYLYVKVIDDSPIQVGQEPTIRIVRLPLTDEQKAVLAFKPDFQWLQALSVQED